MSQFDEPSGYDPIRRRIIEQPRHCRSDTCQPAFLIGTIFPPSFNPSRLIRPGLHHLAAFLNALSAVISGADFVSLGVGQLKLDQIRMPALFVE